MAEIHIYKTFTIKTPCILRLDMLHIKSWLASKRQPRVLAFFFSK